MTSGDAARRQVRLLLLAAIRAANHGVPADTGIAAAVTKGDRELSLDAFEFDSLAWMEFCIYIEAETGADLTPAEIVDMRRLCEIEDWIYERV
jgi:hypothetical protein